MKITHPVILQRLKDELGAKPTKLTTPLLAGQVQQKGDPVSGAAKEKYYRSGVGKLLYMSKHSWPEMLNCTRELSRFCSKAYEESHQGLKRAMDNAVSTEDRGLVLEPITQWNGGKDKTFRIHGMSDAAFGSCADTRRSVSGWTVFLDEAPVLLKSKMQERVALSVKEAELRAATACASLKAWDCEWRNLWCCGWTTQGQRI